MLTVTQRKQAAAGLEKLLATYNQDCAQLARAINATPAAVRQWKRRGVVSNPGYHLIYKALGVAVAKACRPDLLINS